MYNDILNTPRVSATIQRMEQNANRLEQAAKKMQYHAARIKACASSLLTMSDWKNTNEQ